MIWKANFFLIQREKKASIFFETTIAGLLNDSDYPKEMRRLWSRRHCHVPHHREPGPSH
jgi:hypothetical protein